VSPKPPTEGRKAENPGNVPELPVLLVALIALAFLVGGVSYLLLRQMAAADLGHSARALAADIRPSLRFGNPEIIAATLRSSALIAGLKEAALTDPNGRELARYAPPDPPSGAGSIASRLDISDDGRTLAQLRLEVSAGSILAISLGMGGLWLVVGGALLGWHWRTRDSQVAAMEKQQEEIRALAHHCELTGLPNRKLFADRLAHALANHDRKNETLVVLMLDVANFKLINDVHGVKVGDAVLRHVGSLLTRTLRDADTVSRLGNDEFAVILEHSNEIDAARVAGKLLQAMDSYLRVGEKKFQLSAHIGMALYPRDGQEVEMLLRQTETALRHAKAGDKNSFSFFSPEMSAHAQRELEMETQLRKALKRSEFSLHYQPQVDAKTRRVVGLEALLRWRNKKLGQVPPTDFIPIAESSGLINPIGEWVMHAACQQAARWHAMALAGADGLTMSVNLSARQLSDPGIVGVVRRALEESRLPPRLLILEITESSLTHPDPAINDRLNAFIDLGVSLAVDDFGTGYSSLSYLKRFPITKLKIDRSFVHDIPNNPDDVAITSAIIGMGRGLNMELIAEGVELESQMRFLADKGCAVLQGYLFGKPLPADEIENLVQQVNAPYLAD
jgi:diguanylate cyclase (GGDEF)-like protein